MESLKEFMGGLKMLGEFSEGEQKGKAAEGMLSAVMNLGKASEALMKRNAAMPVPGDGPMRPPLPMPPNLPSPPPTMPAGGNINLARPMPRPGLPGTIPPTPPLMPGMPGLPGVSPPAFPGGMGMSQVLKTMMPGAV